jgi:hypothetical protein
MIKEIFSRRFDGLLSMAGTPTQVAAQKLSLVIPLFFLPLRRGN